MTNEQKRAKARKFALERDVLHVVRIVRRKARAAKAKGGKISTDNVRNAVEAGPLRLLPAFSDRKYLSALYGQAMLVAAKEGYTKAAGWTRTKRIGKRGGGTVRLWRAA